MGDITARVSVAVVIVILLALIVGSALLFGLYEAWKERR